MPERSINDLTSAEKTRIALECIVLEMTVDPKASETLSYKYNLSKRGVTQLKSKALGAIDNAFSATPDIPLQRAPSVSAATISSNLDSLLKSPAVTKPSTKSASAVEEEELEEDELEADPIDVEDVYDALVDWNDSENTPLIYISAGLLEKISNSTKQVVKKFVAEHYAEIKEHNTRHNLNSKTNLSKELRDFNYHDKLGLLDLEAKKQK